jgi:hypothetical protein
MMGHKTEWPDDRRRLAQAIEARAIGLDLVKPAPNRGERIAPGTRLVAGQVQVGWAE